MGGVGNKVRKVEEEVGDGEKVGEEVDGRIDNKRVEVEADDQSREDVGKGSVGNATMGKEKKRERGLGDSRFKSVSD